jgi:hypothetical protein
MKPFLIFIFLHHKINTLGSGLALAAAAAAAAPPSS